jgi:hypothetical protein
MQMLITLEALALYFDLILVLISSLKVLELILGRLCWIYHHLGPPRDFVKLSSSCVVLSLSP